MTPDQKAGTEKQNAPHLAKYGLTHEPFADTDDPGVFYADADREQRLDLMQHLAPYSEILLVIGGQGAGKTTLLRQFIARAGETWRTALVSAHPGMDREELLAAVLGAFGLPLDISVPLERRRAVLIDHLHALRRGARMPILIVDDAHHLDADALELLLDFCEQNEAEHLLAMILVGTPQLQAMLAEPALAPLQNRVAHTFDVPPFSEFDTARYLRHRMRAAGAADEGPFTPEVVSKIHTATGGVPVAINEMAHYVLSERPPSGSGAAARADRGISGADAAAGMSGPRRGLDKRWIAAALAGIAIVAVFVAGRFGGEEPPTERTVALSPPPAPSSPSEGAQVIRDEPPPVEVPPVAAEPPLAATEPPTPAAPPPPIADVPPGPATPPRTAVSPPPPTPVAKTPPAAPSATPDLKGADWVRAQPSDHSTLQLMALKDEQAVRRIIARHRLADAAYFPVRRDGRTLYVLVYGSYPSREAATRAAAELPAGLVSGQPWVRNFQSLQKELGN